MTTPLATAGFVGVLEAVAWPAVVVFLLWGLTTDTGRGSAEKLLGPMRRVKAGIFELELGEDQGRKIKASLEETFEDFRSQVDSAFELEIERYDVNSLCAGVAENVLKPLLKEEHQRHFKCTVYVRDIVFKDVLYRLLNYYPGGTGRGNIYSARFGIIGRAWRLGEDQYEPRVPGDAKTLITEWSMTREEASGQEAKSFLTFHLRREPSTSAVGLLFLESEEDAFESDPIPALETDPQVAALTQAVEEVMTEMRGSGPMLELFKN